MMQVKAPFRKDAVIRVVKRRAVYRELDRFEGVFVLFCKRKHHVGDYGRAVSEGSAAESPQNKDIDFILHGDIKDPAIAFSVDADKLVIRKHKPFASVARVVAVGRIFAEIRRGAGDHVAVKPVAFRHALWS